MKKTDGQAAGSGENRLAGMWNSDTKKENHGKKQERTEFGGHRHQDIDPKTVLRPTSTRPLGGPL